MNEFRRDPLTGRTVIISTARDARPNQFQESAERVSPKTFMDDEDDSSSECQFCAAQMVTPPLLAAYHGENGSACDSNLDSDLPEADWQVCVVPNLYPSLSTMTTQSPERKATAELGVSDESIAAQGFHEVVIESPTHTTRCVDLTDLQFRLMLRAYRDRMRFMAEQPSIKYVQVIKNSGELAGASVKHTHSQIFGLPIVPEMVQRELDGATTYFDERGECFFCDVIRQVTSRPANGRSRLVVESDEFVAWCPYSSRVSFEVHIAPKMHRSQFRESGDEILGKLGAFLQVVLRGIDCHPRINAFNYLIHSLPFDSKRYDHYHWHIEIIPRIAKQAGFEWGTGIHINTVSPESAAQELRSLL